MESNGTEECAQPSLDGATKVEVKGSRGAFRSADQQVKSKRSYKKKKPADMYVANKRNPFFAGIALTVNICLPT